MSLARQPETPVCQSSAGSRALPDSRLIPITHTAHTPSVAAQTTNVNRATSEEIEWLVSLASAVSSQPFAQGLIHAALPAGTRAFQTSQNVLIETDGYLPLWLINPWPPASPDCARSRTQDFATIRQFRTSKHRIRPLRCIIRINPGAARLCVLLVHDNVSLK